MRAFFSAFVLAITITILASCGEQKPALNFYWSRHQEKAPQIPAPLESALASEEHPIEINVAGEQILQTQQKMGDIPIHNTWVKAIKNSKGELEAFQAQWFPEITGEARFKLKLLSEHTDDIVNYLKRGHEGLREAHFVYPPRIELKEGLFGLSPELLITYVKSDETDVLELRTSASGKLLEEYSVAQHLTHGVADVFPGNPNQNQVMEVTLEDLVGNGTLTSSRITVLSMLPDRAFSSRHHFKYSPDIHQFNEVQSFYYAQQTVNWFLREFDLTLPVQLNIKTHIGGTKPTNAAFYYQGNIRLGDGDGVVYQNIPRDPSIVSHEVAHAYIDAVASLPFEGEGGSLNEAFADFFTALRLNNPRMAEYSYLRDYYKRNLENELRADRDFQGKRYGDSLVVSGLLWSLRESLGVEKSGDLAMKTLSRLSPSSGFRHFWIALHDAAKTILSVDEKQRLDDVLTQRGWTQWWQNQSI
jgi:hypothetical protein